MSDMLSALILGIVEGLTEFLPVSSTGHMIIVGHMIGFDGNLAKIFDVVIQLGGHPFCPRPLSRTFCPFLHQRRLAAWGKRG